MAPYEQLLACRLVGSRNQRRAGSGSCLDALRTGLVRSAWCYKHSQNLSQAASKASDRPSSAVGRKTA